MYLRDSQGRLRWFPPAAQGLDPFADPGGPSYAFQYAMIRQQLQQEEWMRFNAPPVGDQVHFETEVTPTTEYVAAPARPLVSMGHMVAAGNDPRLLNNGNYQAFGPGLGPTPRPHFELPVPSPRAAAFVGRNPAPPPSPLSSWADRSAPKKAKKAVLPAAATNVSCMNTLFGAQVSQQHPNVSGIMACNQVDPTNLDFDIKLPSHYNMDRFVEAIAAKSPTNSSNSTKLSNPMQVFHCNGVRGPPKKFDYSFKPKLPECHVNTDIFYDAVQEENPGSDPSAGADILSVHESFDEKTFLMDIDVVTPPPQRKRKGTTKKKIARRKTPQPILEENEVPRPKNVFKPTNEEYRDLVESRDSIEATREPASPPKQQTTLKVPRQPVEVTREAPRVVEEPEIESEDSKDAMYESVTNRKKPDPINVPQLYTGPAAIISPKDVVQKIASRDIIPSPETVPDSSETKTTPQPEPGLESEVVPLRARARKPSSRSRSCQPKTRSKSKSKRSESVQRETKAELTATDQAALAKSIREICLKATPELNGEEYPSFDEQPKDDPKDLRPGRDSPASETSGSGGENKQQVANKEEKKKRRSKTEKAKRSSSVRPSSRKEKVKETQSGSVSLLQDNDATRHVFSERMQRLRGECKAWHVVEQY